MDASLMERMKELEPKNQRLKKMYAEEQLMAEITQEALEGKWLILIFLYYKYYLYIYRVE